MGSFYSNIHVRTTQREAVSRAWQHYWEGRGEASWAFISPAYGGWISLFDWRCDQMQTDTLTELASTLSRSVDSVAIAFQVQDSDLAEYWLFHHGNEVDHYTSNTDFFAAYAQQPGANPDEEGIYVGYGPDEKFGYPEQEDLTDGGNAELLRSLSGTSSPDMELEAILRTPAAIADDILTALASAIGINDIWASLGYQTLVSDGDTVSGMAEFGHLPDGTPPNTERAHPDKAA